MAAVALAAVAAGVTLFAGGGSDKGDQNAAGRISGAPEIFLEPASSPGTDPFTTSVDPAPTTTTSTTAAAAPAPSSSTTTATAAPAEATAVRSRSGAQPGLYGGTRNNSSCNREQLVGFLQANPAKAAAWAGVHGIPVEQIPAYVAALTPVRLQADTRVTNHGFKNGQATTLQSVLQAGTAVLVDDRGVPRARCACGNPLGPAVAAQSAPDYVGTPWPGFSPADTTVVAPAPAPVQHFVLSDEAGGKPFARPTGTDGGADTLTLPPGGPEIPESTTTTTLAPSTTTTTAPDTAAPTIDATSEGTVEALSTYGGNQYPAALGVDGDVTTSWFSSGGAPPDAITTFTWTGRQEDLITSISILNNALHESSQLRKNHGFDQVRIEVYKTAGGGSAPALFSETVDLAGTPDPNVNVTPNVRGQRIVLTFFGHEDKTRGGFSELQVGVLR